MVARVGAMLVLGASLALSSGCGGSFAARAAGEPCTRDRDCNGVLVCRAGVCVIPMDASDADVDAATDAAADADGASSDAPDAGDATAEGG